MIGLVRPHAKRCLDAMRAWSPSGALSMSVYLVVQIVGVLLSFATVILVARWGGAATQGVFFTYKTLVDFLTASILFGLPQAYVFVINKGKATVNGLALLTLLYSAGSVLIAIIVISIQINTYFLPHTSLFAILILSAGVGGYVLHGLARGIILTQTAAWVFSMFSVAPAVVLLLTIIFQFSNERLSFPTALGVTGLVSGFAGAVWLSRISQLHLRDLKKLPYPEIVTQSLHTFIQSSLFAAQPVLTLAMLRARSATDADIGNFSIAITAFAAINVVVSVTAPVLFNRWSKSISWDQYATLALRTYWVSAALMALAWIVILAARPVVGGTLGTDYEDAVVPIQLMTLAVFPLLCTRFLSSAIHALGYPSVNSLSCFARLGMVGVFFALGYPLTGDILATGALSWVAAEWVAFVVQTGAASRARRAAVMQ
jgi:O-antigen/teichoic acid export membrane protein